MKSTGKSVIKRIAKITAWTIGITIALVVLLLSAAVWILTPARLTPLVRDIANKNLNAEVTLSKAELTLWKTFPHLYIDLDSVTVKSDAFAALDASQRALLPQDADTLVSIDKFHGAINLPALLKGDIKLYDVELTYPKVNAVSYNNEICNFYIVPESEESAEAKSSGIPDISINRFEIINRMPIRYISIADSLDISLTLRQSRILNADSKYEVTLDSDLKALLPPDIDIDSMTVAIDGKIQWLHERPEWITLENFNITAGPVRAVINSSINFATPLTFENLAMTVNSLSPEEVISYIPDKWRGNVKELSTDMKIDMAMELTRPYPINSKAMPSCTADIVIKPCKLKYDHYALKDVEADITVAVNGDDINQSTVSLRHLRAATDGARVSVKGSATSLLKNPYIDAHIKASADFSKLPYDMRAAIPGSIKGRLEFDSDARLHLKDLTPKRFHRILVNGNLALHDIDASLPENGIDLYTRNAKITLGTNTSFVTDAQRVDSLLTASVNIDTIRVSVSGMDIAVKELKGGIGCTNKASSSDTTQINPIGATIKAEGIRYIDSDSIRMWLRGAKLSGAIQRYEGQGRVPLLRLNTGADVAVYADRFNRLFMRNGNFDIKAHMKPRRELPPRLKARYDSLSVSHPGLAPDSIFSLMRKSMPDRKVDMSKYDILDFGLNQNTKRMLLKWDVSGSMTAERGMLFSTYFPLRNRIENIDLCFTTDSVRLNDMKYKAGHSDFRINGAIRNLRQALISRRPVQINLTVESDTLDINQIVQASYKGAAFAEQVREGSISIDNIEDEKAMQQLADSVTQSGETSALLVPMNVRADINMKAKHVMYADITMQDFKGDLLINNGALNLRDLSAGSAIGGAALTALYTAPTKNDIRFGFGLKLNDMHIKEFINLIPAVDSLMPLLKDFDGVIDADIAATTEVDSCMNLILPSLEAAIKLSGENLVLLDAETFKTLSKWLMFKDKKRNVIPHMEVEMLVDNSTLELFPFVFDFDRYRLAVMGSNDLALNYKYHISVLKSPMPFKFGLNLSGNTDKMKVRLGKAKYKPDQAGETIAIVDTTRINLLKEIDRVFSRGAKAARLSGLKVSRKPEKVTFEEFNDTISHNDSIMFIEKGILPKPESDE